MTFAEFAKEHRVTLEVARIPMRTDSTAGDWDKDASHWVVCLSHCGRRAAWEFSMGSVYKGAPEAGLVLESLATDVRGSDTFEDFCGNCGYDEDSRRAFKLWEACCKTRAKLTELFGWTLLNKLLECEE